MVDFSNVLRSSAKVQGQAHWESIADATYNLHQPTQGQFDRLKSEWPEPVDVKWFQALKLFNPKPAHPLKAYNTEDFQVFLPPSTADVGDVWDLNPDGILPFLLQFHALFTLDASIDARFMPAQFAGRLVISRNDGSIIAFALSLPSRNSLEFVQHLPTNEFHESFPHRKRKSEYFRWLKLALTQVHTH